MSHDFRPPGSAFPGFVLLMAIAAMIVALVSVRQPTQAARVWVPAASAGATSSIHDVGETCARRCKSIDPA